MAGLPNPSSRAQNAQTPPRGYGAALIWWSRRPSHLLALAGDGVKEPRKDRLDEPGHVYECRPERPVRQDGGRSHERVSVSARVGALHHRVSASKSAPAALAPVRLRTDRSHDDVLRANIGWELEPWKWAAACNRRDILDAQTVRLADLLEAAGVEARMQTDVVAISAVTGIVRPVSAWRAIRFLPAVATRDRRPMLNALRYWMEREHDRPEYMRYGVVTAGDLVPAHGDLREALQGLARKVSKWAAEADDRYGIEVHFRGSEFTRKTAAERGLDPLRFPQDLVLYHPHANVLIEPRRLLPKEGAGSWSEFLSWTHDHFGAHWKDCGRVEDVRELVKYVVKPGDLLDGDRPLDSAEAAWLHESLFRLNLAQPLGAFRTFCQGLNKARKKIVTLRCGEGGRLVPVIKGTRLNHADKDREAFGEGEDRSESVGGKPANLFIGVTLPQWAHSPWAEPMIMVQNYKPGAVGKAACDRLKEIDIERMLARDRWDKAGAPDPRTALQVGAQWRAKGGGSNVVPLRPMPSTASPEAAPYRVHTCSLTVRPEGMGGEAEGSVPPPPKPPPRGQVVPIGSRTSPSNSPGPARIGLA